MTPRALAMVPAPRPTPREPLAPRWAALCSAIRATIAREGADAASADVEPLQRIARGLRVARMRERLAEAEGWERIAGMCEGRRED